MDKRKSHQTDFHETFYLGILLKFVITFQSWLKVEKKVTGALH
jgi:hypothetical protein